MKINIGTANAVKIEALREAVGDSPELKTAEVVGMDTGSAVADQPKTLAETVRGAQNRARACFHDCDFSVGIEDGLMAVPGTLTGFMNVGVCAFYDGKRFYLGTSAAFEYPPKAIGLVSKGFDINQAFHMLGMTDDPKVGSSEGAIGVLTRGRWTRKDTAKQAVIAAMLQVENKDWYSGH